MEMKVYSVVFRPTSKGLADRRFFISHRKLTDNVLKQFTADTFQTDDDILGREDVYFRTSEKHTVPCEISSSHGGEYDVQSCLLGYTAV
jgi:hypothetical protein